MKTISRKYLIIISVVLVISMVCTFLSASYSYSDDYEDKIKAATLMALYSQKVREYKEELGIEKNELDINDTWLIGDEFTEITTTLGEIGAKRTSANPDSAALAVEMLKRKGVKNGDTVAAAMTGSFFGFDLAFLAASEVMDLNLVYMVSVGSSMYGANQPNLTFPDVLFKLIDEGYVTNKPIAVSMGGDWDIGAEMIDTERDMVKARMLDSGYTFIEIPDYQQNIAKRLEMYGKYDFDVFVGIGGNVTTLGRSETGKEKGLLKIYEQRGLKTIQIMDIKKMVADYNMEFDPIHPIIGESDIYFETHYNKIIPVIGLCLSFAILWKGKKDEKIS